MCAAPTLVADPAWCAADAAWERLQAEAAALAAADDHAAAGARAADALRLARAEFDPDDPRLATSLVNLAMTLRRRGDRVADQLLVEALRVLDQAPGWLDRQQFARRARSSMFHLRLEAKHRGEYEANLRRRAETMLAEGRAASAALAAGAPDQVPGPAACEALGRAPPGAMRKVLAAVQLLATARAAPSAVSGAAADQEGS